MAGGSSCSSWARGSRDSSYSRGSRNSTELPILKPQTNWENLFFYQKTVVLYQMTVVFCRRFLPKFGDRTVDQMVQAARSGKQNIVEGFADGVTSTEKYIKPIEDVLNRHDDEMQKEMEAIKDKVEEAYPDVPTNQPLVRLRREQKRRERKMAEMAKRIMFEEVMAKSIPCHLPSVGGFSSSSSAAPLVLRFAASRSYCAFTIFIAWKFRSCPLISSSLRTSMCAGTFISFASANALS